MSDISEPEFSKALDAEIDDPELMFAKKHLCAKFTPLSMVSSLQGKHKNLCIQEHIDEKKDHGKN